MKMVDQFYLTTYRPERYQRTSAFLVLVLKRVCGPLANSLLHYQPTSIKKTETKIEAAYRAADQVLKSAVD